jgi:hypothetical protein
MFGGIVRPLPDVCSINLISALVSGDPIVTMLGL